MKSHYASIIAIVDSFLVAKLITDIREGVSIMVKSQDSSPPHWLTGFLFVYVVGGHNLRCFGLGSTNVFKIMNHYFEVSDLYIKITVGISFTVLSSNPNLRTLAIVELT